LSFLDRRMAVRVVLALGAMLAALALSACGDDDDGGDAKAPSADSAQAPDGGNANASDGGSANGASGNASSGDTEPVNLTQARLTSAERQRLQEELPTPRPYKEVFDRGFPKQKATLLRIYRQMQREFYGGRFLAFCKRFTDSLVALPNLESGDSQDRFKECAGIVSRVAKRLAQGKLDWRPNRIQWIRVYNDRGQDPYGGVTVIGGLRQVRVGFVKENGSWRPDFKIPGDLEAIGAS
jgi:hypothetical protein